MTALRRNSGADFDKAYVADRFAARSNALTLHSDCMLLEDDAKLNALAVEMIPIVEAQLETAQTFAGDDDRRVAAILYDPPIGLDPRVGDRGDGRRFRAARRGNA